MTIQIAIGILLMLLAFAVPVSINVLLRGSIWGRLRPDARPRRWVLWWLLVSLCTTCVWLPLFVFYPNSRAVRITTIMWGVIFGGMCLTLKWLGPLVDLLYKRKGWPLR